MFFDVVAVDVGKALKGEQGKWDRLQAGSYTLDMKLSAVLRFALV